MRPRAPDWRPVFGQVGPAQGHLRNEGVSVGDVFLFFGLFRRLGDDDRFIPGAPAIHATWGWLQIGEIAVVDRDRSRLTWAGDHPHLAMQADPSNTLYIAADKLRLPGGVELPGAGLFGTFSPRLRLTAPDSTGPSTWLLPAWFHPEGRGSALSYHGKATAWERCPEGVRLKTVGRGQEFVLHAQDYPESVPWLEGLLAPALHPR